MQLMLCSFVLVLQSAVPAHIQAEIRASEVWLIRNGTESQLTRDGKSKPQAVLSPSQDRIAYYEQCPEPEHCTPAVVILDLDGHRVVSFEPKLHAFPGTESCASILSIAWAGRNAVAAECHINPSASEYIETDIVTGKVNRSLYGYNFTPSPDGTRVAHVGGMVHFAPPYAKSNYLQIDRTIIYPLPKGMRAVEQKDRTESPNVVRQEGLTFSGIHDFMSDLHWSPDGRRIALIDCTYDWTANSQGTLSAADGVESNRRCFLTVVSPDGQSLLFPLTDVPLRSLWNLHLSWDNPRLLSLDAPSGKKTFAGP
jgi:hypothetical protein